MKLTPLSCTLVPMEVTMEVFMEVSEVTVTDTVSVLLTVLVTATVLVITVTTPKLSKLEPFTLTLPVMEFQDQGYKIRKIFA